MYQFMVATTRSGASCASGSEPNSSGAATGEIRTMSLTSGTNKWASRAVVALQLAAWSAVGIVLLEKGITSLQKSNAAIVNSAAENNSQVPTARSSDRSESIVGAENVVPIIPLVPINDDNESVAIKESTSSVWRERTVMPIVTEGSSTVYQNSQSTQRTSVNDATISSVRGQLEAATGDKQINSVQSNKNDQSSRLNEVGRGQRESSHPTNKDVIVKSLYNNKINLNKESSTGIDATNERTTGIPIAIKVTPENSEETAANGWSSANRKRLRIAQVNSAGGAAAAVAMVAVGAVMLVLGPAVIVLRAIDERRQERRFLKLSVDEDLPPSYEQATGSIEQAPTYSSLNLDTISPPCSSSSNNNSAMLP